MEVISKNLKMLVCNWYYLKILIGAVAISSKHTTNIYK